MKKKGICEFCEEVYEKPAINQKFCSKACREKKKINESTMKWIVRKPRKAKLGLSDKLDRMAMFNNYRALLKK